MEELIAALEDGGRGPEVRAIVIEGAGPAFSAGHDLGEMVGRDAEFYERLFDVCTELMETIHRVPQPVIAKVHGDRHRGRLPARRRLRPRRGGRGARFATPGVKIGLFCSTPMVPLSRAVGRKRALEMLLTGEPIDAAKRADWGLVNRVVPADELEGAVGDPRRADRGVEPAHGADRQGGVLPAGRARRARRLRADAARDGRERAGRRRTGRDGRLPGEAPADLVGQLAKRVSTWPPEPALEADRRSISYDLARRVMRPPGSPSAATTRARPGVKSVGVVAAVDDPGVVLEDSRVDLYWLPVGAGGWFVRLNGKAYEAVVALRERRARRDLYHSALVVETRDGRSVIESAPVRPGDGAARGVFAEGAVGARTAGRSRLFRYELRCWLDGVIPDVEEAVESPQTLTSEPEIVRRVLDLMPLVPTPVWGRDELGTGDMWNSNSVIAWLVERVGLDAGSRRPPAGGRAPGWSAGVDVARRADGAPAD